MMRIPHELPEEFPGEAHLVERLKASDHDFARLAARYDEVNGVIQRIEGNEEAAADERLERLKKSRLKLKDEIAAILSRVETPT